MMTALTHQTLYVAQEHPPTWKLVALENLTVETDTLED
jgi:hypothetical protein